MVNADISVLNVILLPYVDRDGIPADQQEDAAAVAGKFNAMIVSFGKSAEIKTAEAADLFLSHVLVLKNEWL